MMAKVFSVGWGGDRVTAGGTTCPWWQGGEQGYVCMVMDTGGGTWGAWLAPVRLNLKTYSLSSQPVHRQRMLRPPQLRHRPPQHRQPQPGRAQHALLVGWLA